MAGRLGRLFELLNLGLEVFQVLLLAFAEGALGGAVLCFPLLELLSVLCRIFADVVGCEEYEREGLRGNRLH